MNATHGRWMAMAAASVLALAGNAMAQTRGGGGGGDFDKPLNERTPRAAARQGQPGSQSRSITTLQKTEGDNQIELRIENGELSAKVNGKKVPEDRIRRKGARVEILDKEGEVLTTFMVGRAGGSTGGGTWVVGPDQPQPFTMLNPPKVMLGINMVPLTDEVREELELDEGEGVLVQRVIEGTPAAEAGLQENDVIVEVEGHRPATAETVREALKGKNPGDTVSMSIRREGKSKSIKVKLAAYDQGKMQQFGTQFFPPGADNEEMQRMLREHMRGLEGTPYGQGGQIFGPGEEGMHFRVPGREDPELSKRMKELEGRMKELDKRLEKLNQQLDKLQQQLDR
jgi:hypothetical protein